MSDQRKDSGGPEDSNMSSTSDFVKKLYKMLEDQTFQNVVSWGPQGDCFVVKDMNEFTKSILPRMFKHSNFASFVRQLNKYDFHKVKNTDDNQFGEHSWTFRHPDFHADRRDTLENIKRKVPTQRKSMSSSGIAPAPIAMPPQLTPSSSTYPTPTYPQSGNFNPYQMEAQNAKIEGLQAQLSSLSAAHDEVLSHVRNLERNYQEVLVEMVGFQRGMAQQDGLMQNLIQYFLRENNSGNGNGGQMKQLQNPPEADGGNGGNPFLFMQTQETQRMLDKSFPETDVARATLVQMSEISRRAEAAGMSFGSSSSSSRLGGSGAGNVGASGIGAAMGRMDMLARIEELQAQRTRNSNNVRPGASSLFSNSNENSNAVAGPSTSNGRMDSQEQRNSMPRTESLDSEDYEDEMVVPTPTNPPSLNVPDMSMSMPSPDSWDLSAGDGHQGLEVYTVGHLMPRGSGGFMDDRSNWSFDAGTGIGAFGAGVGEMVGNQEAALSPSDASGNSSSPPQTQTLRVRRSTFVPGWAVPPRVLLVDDDAVSRKLSSKFLQVFGCTIDVAVDGVGAVNKMNLEKYDLVLMDIVMPKLDGVSATSMIRKFDPQTPIISMTSNSKPNEIMTYYSSGMNDILPKPFTKEGLLDMLEKHLTHLTVIKQRMTTTPIPRAPMGVPPLNDAGFESALQAGAASLSPQTALMGYGLGSPDDGEGRINVLAGMGLTDEQYNVMLAGIVNGEGFNFGEKRSLDFDDENNGRSGKRSRFEVIE
ncbi:HSF-type DNA-binding-domain-containing protein [Mycena sp. CBHHK59/15]|nr:HSF-type DNA-binding-domain-containing protein [Mycena sp. CBHHK59/15]